MKVTECLDLIHDTLSLAEPVPSRQSSESTSAGWREPIKSALIEAKTRLHTTLVSWARMVSEEQPRRIDCEDETLSIAGWLWQSANFLESHPAREDFITEIREACHAIRRFVDTIDDRVFLGIHAGQMIYARHGQATVVLPNGRVEKVKTLRDELKAKTLKKQGTAKEVSIILRDCHGLEVTAKSITSAWREDKRARERGRLGHLEGLDIVAMDGSKPVFVVDEVLTRMAKAGKIKVA